MPWHRLVLAPALLSLAVGSASAQEVAPPAASEASILLDREAFQVEDEEVILAVTLRDDLVLSDGIFAYLGDDDVLVPFEELMFLAQFPIRVLDDGQRAEGWFISEDRRFTLDVAGGRVVSDGRSFTFDPTDLRPLGGELYVPSRLVSDWLPLDLAVDLRALDLVIDPRETIAIDEQVARQNRPFGTTYRVFARLPERRTPYRLLAVPSLDVDLAAGVRTGGDDDAFAGYTIRADGDLLWNNSSLVVFGSDEDVTDARIRLGRENPRGGLLGRLNATVVEAGDVAGAGAPLITNTVAGRGVRIARRSLDYVGNLDTIVIEGPLEPGYEVELYRNGILIDAQNPSGTQYRFDDVLLIGGRNLFRLEFYGPQGQRRTETEQYLIGASRAREGQLLYDVAVTQPGQTVFGVRDITEDYGDEDIAASVRFDYGISQRLTGTAGVFYAPVVDADESRIYGTAGLRTNIGDVFLTADTAVDDAGGIAGSVGANTQYGDVTVSARQEVYLNDFRSNRSFGISEREIMSRSRVDVSSFSRTLFEDTYVSGTAGAELDVFDDGGIGYRFDGGFNANTGTVSFGSDLIYRDDGEGNTDFDGASRVNLRFRDFRFRASTDYDILPTFDLRSASAQVGRTFGDGYEVNLGYRNDFLADTQNAFLGVTKDIGYATLGALASHRIAGSQEDETTLLLTLSFSTFTDPDTFDTVMSSNRRGRGGAVRADVFLDENQNGLRDPGEAPVSDVAVFAGFDDPVVTGEDGSALLLARGRSGWVDVTLDPESLSDPSWRSGTGGFAVLPRPGMVSSVDLPVVVTVDVEGFVTLNRGEEPMPLSNVTVQAVAPDGTVTASAQSAFDGLYVMDGVPVGAYVLRIDPEQAKRLGVVDAPVLDLPLRPGQDIVTDRNLDLRRR